MSDWAGVGWRRRVVALATAAGAAACGGSAGRIDGLQADASLPITCGAGTSLFGNECLPVGGESGPPANGDAGSVVCGAGTSLVASVCTLMVDGGSPAESGVRVVCGPGTYDDGGACVPSYPGLGCGPGTRAQGGLCVAMPMGDDAGTAGFEVRVPSQVQADGYSAVPVVALGPVPDEGGAGPSVVLGVWPSLGTLVDTQLVLGPVGATTYYRPCSTADGSCAGTVQITMALASAPTKIVATSNPMTLVAPTGIGDPSPCLTGGNVLFFDGDSADYIHPGLETISQASWQATYSTNSVGLFVSSSAQSSGTTWMLDFTTTQLGQALAPQVYVDAERAPFAASGHPGLEITGDGRGCNTISGSFQIETLDVHGSTLRSFTATFEQHCEAGTPALRGCVHFEQ